MGCVPGFSRRDPVSHVIRKGPLGAQRGHDTLADCILSQIRCHQVNAKTNPWNHPNVASYDVNWLNGRNLDKGIGNELDKRCDEYKPEPDGRRTNSVIDLSFGRLFPQGRKIRPEKLDPELRALAVSQIHFFVFVFHDSTSSTICYILHLLATNPNALIKVRVEHDRFLGTDLSGSPLYNQRAGPSHQRFHIHIHYRSHQRSTAPCPCIKRQPCR